jgi:spermidine synthase
VSPAPRGARRVPLPLAALLFALVGAAALIVQTLWLRELRLALGGAHAAVSATLAALVLGQAGGAWIGGRIVARSESSLRAFGALAAAGALFALATPQLLRLGTAALDAHYDALREAALALAVARGAAALLATLPATLALGALAPVLYAACLGGARTLGRTGVWLYALNALGAAAGAALATFVLVEQAGLNRSLRIGAGGTLVCGVAALAASRWMGRIPPAHWFAHEDDADAAPKRELPRWLLGAAAISGFGSLAAQGLFAQALGRISNQSTYASGAMLVVALVCVALGALFVATLSRRTRPRVALGVSLALTAGALVVFPAYFVTATGGLRILEVAAPWPAYLWAFATVAFATLAPVLLPAACVFPSVLAVASEHCARDPRSLGAASARLLTWNAVGALAGALLAPAALVPALGLWGALAALGGAYLLGAWHPLAEALAPRFTAYAAILIALMVAVARPHAQPALRVPAGERVVHLEESAAGLVAVLEGADGRKLQLDNHYFLGGARDRVRQERQGHLPLLLHPAPRRVLLRGSATASTASAALAHGAESITLVEIVPGVARAAREWFQAENRGVYAHASTRVVTDDAVSFLRASRERFDVIVGDLFVPWQAGSGALFSAPHFANARARLAKGGAFCQWLPLYQLTREEFALIARGFTRAFGEAQLLRGDFLASFPIAALCGGASGEPLRAPRWRALPGVEDRWIAHELGPALFYIGRIESAQLGVGTSEHDRRPALEFVAARSQGAARLVGIDWLAFTEQVTSRESARAGDLLQGASALFAAKRTAEAQDAFASAAEMLPPELVRDAPPDPSSIELWHTRSD